MNGPDGKPKDHLASGNNWKQKRYNELLEAGFDKAWIDQVILNRPSLFDNPKSRLAFLESKGFKDPVKMITSLPTILGLAEDNINRKIRLLYLIHGDRERAVGEFEKFPTLLGYKWRRLLFTIRISNPDGLRKLITISPQLLAAAKGKTGSDNPTRLATAARALKRLDVNKILEELVDNKSIDPRLVRALRRI